LKCLKSAMIAPTFSIAVPASTVYLLRKIMGAPGLDFETWDTSNPDSKFCVRARLPGAPSE